MEYLKNDKWILTEISAYMTKFWQVEFAKKKKKSIVPFGSLCYNGKEEYSKKLMVRFKGFKQKNKIAAISRLFKGG